MSRGKTMKRSHRQASSSPLHKVKHHTLKHVKQNDTIYASIALALILLVLFNVTYTGHTISNEEVHIENIGLNFTQNANIEWTPENDGLLKSIKISGKLIGEGSAKIVLVDGTDEYLIVDTSAINNEGNLVTGFAVSNETETNVTENTTEKIIVEENTSVEEPTIENTTKNIVIENVPETIEENITLIENTTEEISETINSTEINNITNTTKTEINTTIIENIKVEINETVNETNTTPIINETTIEETDETIPVVGNITEVEETDNLSAQETESPIEPSTENTTIEINETVIEENITQVIQTQETVIEFNNLCAETCLLPNLNSTSYTIKVILYNATLIIEQIQYTALVLEDETFNVTENVSIELNQSEENTTQISTVEIGKPVRWKRTVNTSKTKEIRLPKETFNITSNEELNIKIKNKTLSTTEYNLEKEYKILSKAYDKDKDVKTKKLIKEIEKDVSNISIDHNITLDFSNALNEIVSISYLTEGPDAVEKQKTRYRKEITISSDIHYTDILAYTDIAESEKDSIRLYRTTGGIREPVSIINYSDSNSNGFIDHIYWMVPHLSNQTYEVEMIVLNVQSYPVVGGNWTTKIETSGVGDLRISGINETTFTETDDDPTTEDDLEFLNLTCGDEQVQDMYIVSSDGEKMPYEAYILKREIEQLKKQLEELK